MVLSLIGRKLLRAPGNTKRPPLLKECIDFGIMKWPTSAVYSGPPPGQSELLVWT